MTHPDALRLIGEVQQEYVVRYGGRDRTPMEPSYFEPPDGAFYVAYRDEASGGDGRLAVPARRLAAGLGPRAAEIKRMYVATTARRGGLARLMLAHLEATARTAGADVMILETGTAAAGGDGAVRVGRLPTRGVVRLLQGRGATQPLLRPPPRVVGDSGP